MATSSRGYRGIGPNPERPRPRSRRPERAPPPCTRRGPAAKAGALEEEPGPFLATAPRS